MVQCLHKILGKFGDRPTWSWRGRTACWSWGLPPPPPPPPRQPPRLTRVLPYWYWPPRADPQARGWEPRGRTAAYSVHRTDCHCCQMAEFWAVWEKWPNKITCGLENQRPRKRPNSKFPNCGLILTIIGKNWPNNLHTYIFTKLLQMVWGGGGGGRLGG